MAKGKHKLSNKKTTESTNSITNEHKMWATLCHLAGMAVYIIPVIGNIGGPLATWLLKRNESTFVDHHGKQALNFQLTFTLVLVGLGAAFLSLFLGSENQRLLLLLLPLLFTIIVCMNFIVIVYASVKTNNGEWFQYPFVIRFFR